MSEVRIVFSEQAGTLELLREGRTVWSSDNDPDVLEELGTDALELEDLPDVLDYLVDRKLLTSQEADDALDAEFPEDEDEADEADDEEEDLNEEDDEHEQEAFDEQSEDV